MANVDIFFSQSENLQSGLCIVSDEQNQMKTMDQFDFANHGII
jgi:hypothetical protein